MSLNYKIEIFFLNVIIFNMGKYNFIRYNSNKKILDEKDISKLKKFKNKINEKIINIENVKNTINKLSLKPNIKSKELIDLMVKHYQLGYEYENKNKYQDALDNYITSSEYHNPKAYIRLIILYSKIEYYKEANDCITILKKILNFMKFKKLNYYNYLKEDYDKMLNNLSHIYLKNVHDNALLLCNLSVI